MKIMKLIIPVVLILLLIQLIIAADGEVKKMTISDAAATYEAVIESCENSKSYCPTKEEMTKDKCRCASYCGKNAGKVIPKTDEHGCGGQINVTETCAGYGGKCGPDCTGEKDYAKGSATTEQKRLDCPSSEFCCIEKGDGEPSTLYDCNKMCEDPDGCLCKGSLTGGESCGDGHLARKGMSCSGLGGGESPCLGMFADVSGEDSQSCPDGCFWYNDPRCGSNKNLGDAIWDWATEIDWIGDRYKRWSEFWSNWGSKFDANEWAQSACNPDSDEWGEFIDDPGRNKGLTSFGDLQGWIGATKAVYNMTDEDNVDQYIYTITWRLGGFSEDMRYIVQLGEKSDGKVVYPNASYDWAGVRSGEVKNLGDASAVVLEPTDHDYACIYLEKVVCDRCSDGRNVCSKSDPEDCLSFPIFENVKADINYECYDCLYESGAGKYKTGFCYEISDLGVRSGLLGHVEEAIPDGDDEGDEDEGGEEEDTGTLW